LEHRRVILAAELSWRLLKKPLFLAATSCEFV
jgi:hypothetical protein